MNDVQGAVPAEVARAGASEAARTPAVSDDEFSIDLQRCLINFFIVFHLVGVIAWNLPTTDLQQTVVNFYRPYMSITGSWQNWCMFSPDPVNANIYLGAKIHYKDGSAREYTFPRITKLAPIAKYRQERWRKLIENTEADSDRPYWPYLARYAAIQMNVTPKTNPVVSVDVERYYNYIALPGSVQSKYTRYVMFREKTVEMPSAQPLPAAPHTL